MNQCKTGYNERLFKSGLRRHYHLARFRWLTSELKQLGCRQASVLELGCFDGKLLDHLPASPKRYMGFDANWEGGLDLAIKKRGHLANCEFHKAVSPGDMNLAADEIFDTAISMETLEHIPPPLVSPYLKKIADHLNGFLFVTVPNEKGPLFLAKWIAKKLFIKDAEEYSLMELIHATLGRSHLVRRREHKGFDYNALLKEISAYFDVVRVSGHPFGFLPTWLCFGVGIVAKSKRA